MKFIKPSNSGGYYLIVSNGDYQYDSSWHRSKITAWLMSWVPGWPNWRM